MEGKNQIKRFSRIGFRANDRERSALEILATLEGRNLSETVRECVRESVARRGIALFSQPVETTAEPLVN
jgi:hypothetical protein